VPEEPWNNLHIHIAQKSRSNDFCLEYLSKGILLGIGIAVGVIGGGLTLWEIAPLLVRLAQPAHKVFRQ
jgi:uncharacterized oligopeptide transporter (OPT) family protein